MSLGTVIVVLALMVYFITSIVFGWRDVWPFGALMAGVLIALGIRNYYLKRK